jgi:hypothetical protein
MKKIPIYAISIIAYFLLVNCSTKNTDQGSNNEDRNMFGHYIPRGLIKSTDNLTPGYVLFNGANSSYVYLINRKGEVVHQWRGQYGVLNSYLMEDGSILMEETDPDYPVFLGDGAYGRLQ